MRTEQAVARAVVGAAESKEALQGALRALCESLGWQLAATWEPDPEGGVRCSGLWSAPGADIDAFAEATKTMRLASGEGLPGRVWLSGAPAWIGDTKLETNLPRRQLAKDAGLLAAIGVPITSDRGIIGVLECFGREAMAPDPDLLASMEVVGGLLGQLAERRRAEADMHVSEQRYRATLEAALDPVVTMDHQGRVIEFNPAAERVFGWRGDDAVGREMAELIVPEELRGPHRAGLKRYLETGQPTLLDQRIEVQAMRADGTRLPVELTITRIDVPGPPVFTGHLRDITERIEAEEELRASRARIVEAADAARRRIERDLHDGAQQQLVGLAVNLRGARTRLAKGETEAASELLDEAVGDLSEAISELRELARGIHPAVLTEGGLDPALRGLIRRSPVPAELVGVPAERLDAAIESAVYFVVSEGLANAARHAGAAAIEIEVTTAHGTLTAEVRDDGAGGADAAGGGLRGLGDRLAALNGHITVVSPAGGGTILRAEVPCGS
ncbi:MAG: PAS domain S-box protein [Solirubrobacteraceae bacterium]|nr:PAS domain S-box protein [Solirubrobacteraceae bacterium]